MTNNGADTPQLLLITLVYRTGWCRESLEVLPFSNIGWRHNPRFLFQSLLSDGWPLPLCHKCLERRQVSHRVNPQTRYGSLLCSSSCPSTQVGAGNFFEIIFPLTVLGATSSVLVRRMRKTAYPQWQVFFQGREMASFSRILLHVMKNIFFNDNLQFKRQRIDLDASLQSTRRWKFMKFMLCV